MVVDSLVPNVALQMEALAGAAMIFLLIFFVVFVLVPIAAMWKIFSKADQPGWAAIVPIYNIYILLQIVGRPTWWLLLMLVPLVNFLVSIVLMLDVSKAFGKGGGFAIGLLLLPFVFLPILGFGSARYQGTPN